MSDHNTIDSFAALVARANDVDLPIDARDRAKQEHERALTLIATVCGVGSLSHRVLTTIRNAGRRAIMVADIQKRMHGIDDIDITPAKQTDPLRVDAVDPPTERRVATQREIRELALKDPRQWFRTFLTVNTGVIGEEPIPFDLDSSHPRSRAQTILYGDFLDRWAAGTPYVPEHTVLDIHKDGRETDKHYIVATKPRQVGSTTFWQKFGVLATVTLDSYRVLFHMPIDDDVKEKLKEIYADLTRLSRLWPQYFPQVVRYNVDENIIDLANGSKFRGRHGQTRGGGVKKVGSRYHMVILSEAGKYERVSPYAWDSINQAIQPAVHEGNRNVIALEGTNDETASELNRVAKLSMYDFRFVGAYGYGLHNGRAVVDTITDPAGRYNDERYEEGKAIKVCERDYALLHRLTPEEIGWRRDELDKLGQIHLMHMEHPASYEECVRSAASGFVQTFQPTRSPTLYADIVWSSLKDADARSVRASTRIADGRLWAWFVDISDVKGKRVALTGDFSSGEPDSDYTVLLAHDADNGKHIASLRERLDPSDISAEMAKIVSLLSVDNTVYVAGENNGPGIAIRKGFVEYGHSRNYTRDIEHYESEIEGVKLWITQTQAVRDSILANFREAYMKGWMEIADIRFIDDADSFVRNQRGKWEAAKRKHERTGERCMDDYVMAAAMQWELIRWMRVNRLAGASADAPSSDLTQQRTLVQAINIPALNKFFKRAAS